MATAAKKPAVKAAPGKSVAVVPPKKSSGALVSIKEQMARELATLGERTAAATGDKINLKEKQFTLPDGSKHDTLELVVVDFVAANTFYEGAYNKDVITPPACFAIGQVITTMVPSKNSPVPQSDTCAGCPMNEYESSGNGKGKACKNGRRLAVLPPDADDDTQIMILDVSPTGLKSFDGFVRSAQAKFGVLPIGLIVEVSFDEGSSYPSLRFGNPAPNENMEVHWGRRDEALKRLMTEPDVSGYQPPAPPKGRKAAPAARR